jgi:8-oxo-dGTP pyrophosphatase MutT (NUDIX family)
MGVDPSVGWRALRPLCSLAVRWTVHGERAVYDSEWMRLVLADVELPGGNRFDHHVVRYPRGATGVAIRDPERGVLLLWRHRFITDTWGWEVPAGGLEPGESPESAAEREALEETGWRPVLLRRLGAYHPSNGSSDQVFYVFVSDSATHVGDPVDIHESERIDWVPIDRVRELITAGEIADGLSLTTLLWMLAFAPSP